MCRSLGGIIVRMCVKGDRERVLGMDFVGWWGGVDGKMNMDGS